MYETNWLVVNNFAPAFSHALSVLSRDCNGFFASGLGFYCPPFSTLSKYGVRQNLYPSALLKVSIIAS